MSLPGITLEKCRQVHDELVSQRDKMMSDLQFISTSVESLTNVWDSPASQNMTKIAAEMNDKFEKLKAKVNEFAEYLDGAITNWEGTEAQISALTEKMQKLFS